MMVLDHTTLDQTKVAALGGVCKDKNDGKRDLSD